MPPETPNKDRKPGAREISAGIVVFRRTPEGPRFLILYHGGTYWNFPKGHIEGEERDLEAALRETKEEAGLSSRDLRLARNFKAYERFSFRRNGQSIFKIVIFYLAETRAREVKISDEHQGYAWFTYREANKILGKYRDSQKVLRQAFEFLGGAVKTQTPRAGTGGVATAQEPRINATTQPYPSRGQRPPSAVKGQPQRSPQAPRPQPQRIYRPQPHTR